MTAIGLAPIRPIFSRAFYGRVAMPPRPHAHTRGRVGGAASLGRFISLSCFTEVGLRNVRLPSKSVVLAVFAYSKLIYAHA